MSSVPECRGLSQIPYYSGFSHPAYSSALPWPTPPVHPSSVSPPATFMPVPPGLQPPTMQSPRPSQKLRKRPLRQITAGPDAAPPPKMASGVAADPIIELRADLRDINQQHKAESVEAARALATLRKELAAARDDIAALQAKLRKKAKKSDVTAHDAAVTAMQQEMAQMRAEVGVLRRERQALAAERRGLDAERKAHTATLASMKNELTGYKELTTNIVQKQGAQITAAVDAAKKACEQVTAAVDAAKKACEQVEFNQQGIIFNTGVTAQCVHAVNQLRASVERTNAQLGYTDNYLDLTDDSTGDAEHKDSAQ